jgi:hypothetical protein
VPDDITPEDDAAEDDDGQEATGKPSGPGPESEDVDAASEEPAKSPRSPAVIAVIAMLVAIATLGASAYMWRNPLTMTPGGSAAPAPAAPAEPTFTDVQRAESRAKVCDAYVVVSAGVSNSGALQAEDGDSIGTVAIATNARLALYGGGQYLLNRVDAATAPDLAEAARGFGNALMDVGAAAMAQIPADDPAHQERLKAADEENVKLQGFCEQQ